MIKNFKLFLFLIILIVSFSCENKLKDCCIKENMSIVDENIYINEVNDKIYELECKDENNLITNFRFKNNKIDTRIEVNGNLWIVTKYDEREQKSSIDTLYINDKNRYPIGWSWYKYDDEGEILDFYQEFFKIGNSTLANQEKVLRNGRIVSDKSLYYEFSQKDSNTYKLSLNLNRNIPDSIMVVLCISDSINNDFSNINNLTVFDSIWPSDGDEIYWILPKDKKNIMGFIEILRVYDDKSHIEFFEKKLYLKKESGSLY